MSKTKNKTKTQQMNISLPSALADFVKRRVESGMYNSSSEVVREGLRLLDEKDKTRETKLQELRKEIQKGLDSGPATPWNLEEFLEDAHRRFVLNDKEKKKEK